MKDIVTIKYRIQVKS